MQVTKGTWHMREQCVPGSLSSSPAQEPGNEASVKLQYTYLYNYDMGIQWPTLSPNLPCMEMVNFD